MTEYRPGDVGFVMHHDNAISKVFSWVMQSKWSHSFVVVGEWMGKTLIVETSDFEVTLNFLDRYVEDKYCSIEVRRCPGLSAEDAAFGVLHALLLLGQVYGYLQLPSFGLRRMLMRMNIRIGNFIRAGLVCCAVPIRFHFGKKTSTLRYQDPEAIDTQELYEHTQSNGWIVVQKKDGKLK